MLKSNIHFKDADLGKIDYLLDYWRFDITDEDGEIIGFALNGGRRQPNLDSLQDAKKVINSLSEFKQAALSFCNRQGEVQDFCKGLGELVLDEVFMQNETGSFDFDFGLTEWEDASVIVHFVNDRPDGFTLGD
ncbi:hypothetical protein [Kangiella sp. TOML190]|uniref:hypothetical protein n=1 Tax=Kangiella sp. TOML190 TaxID=2931351 RepID=UPI00203BBED6|nr:hypothetical protein [Kangiella sp. TOML190]